MGLFVNILFVSTIVAIISSIVGVIFGVISIKTDNVFVNICFNIFINIGAILFCGISVAVLALITISYFYRKWARKNAESLAQHMNGSNSYFR